VNLRRSLVIICCAALLVLLGACGPLGGDDDDDTGPEASNTRQPTATRDVIVSTFTPTPLLDSADKTATQEAQQAVGAATATHRAGLPTPTPANEIDEADILYPPRARLELPDRLADGYLGSYSWQFADEAQTFGVIDAPIIVLEQGPPIEVANGDDLALIYYGATFRTPPEQLEVAIYDFESNSAVPASEQAQGDELAFVIRTDPIQNLRVDPAAPSFTLQGFIPGHYTIWAQGHCGQHPVLNRPIFVTWIFDIEIVE
jgi:hypothetical protein